MVEIERFFGFGIADYEATGGFGDLVIKSDLLSSVKTKIKEHSSSIFSFDKYWVVDMKTYEIIIVYHPNEGMNEL